MNAFITLSALTITLFVFSTAPVSIPVKPAESTVSWIGYKVTGQHTGTVPVKRGDLIYEDNRLTGGTVEIDLAALQVTDLSGDAKTKLEGHLKSDDFFGVQQYPTATLVIDRVNSRGKPGAYRVDGTLTIKGISKKVHFDTDVREARDHLLAVAKLTIDRTEFGVRYGSGSFFDNLGDKTIYDEFDLQIELVAAK